jgi:membrane-associated phospholipid phosphatase
MLSSIKDTVLNWDHIAWYYINTQWHNEFLDLVIPFFRNQWFWAPLYLFLLIYLPYRFGARGFIWCAMFLLAFMCSDQATVTFIKPYFHRVRPCNNPYLEGIVRVLVPRSAGFSFPSAHSANHFSIGMFMAVTLGRIAKWVKPTAIIWATVVAYSQVYVGVHYPIDIACGGILGATIGYCVGKLFNLRFDLAVPPATKVA